MDLIDSKIEYLKIKLCTELLILVGSKTEVAVLEGIIQSSKVVLENHDTKTMTVDHISATEEGKIRACFKTNGSRCRQYTQNRKCIRGVH